MNSVNRLTFAISSYETYAGRREVARAQMFNDIAEFLKILMKNNCIATIRDDDTDIIVIEYEHDDIKDYWGCSNPYWLTPEEYDLVEAKRFELEDDDVPEGNKVIKELGIEPDAGEIFSNLGSLVGKEIDLSKLDDE